MKADEYATKILAAKREEIFQVGSTVIMDMICEVMTIADQRHAKTNQAMLAILKEQGIKWLAIVDRCKDYVQLASDAFRVTLMKLTPDVCKDIPYHYWRSLWPESTRTLKVRQLEHTVAGD